MDTPRNAPESRHGLLEPNADETRQACGGIAIGHVYTGRWLSVHVGNSTYSGTVTIDSADGLRNSADRPVQGDGAVLLADAGPRKPRTDQEDDPVGFCHGRKSYRH